MISIQAIPTYFDFQQATVEPPAHLYKILSVVDWEASQSQQKLQLPQEDDAFIHFSKEDQLIRILNKYWSNEAHCIVLKIHVGKLPGSLRFETNPGGSQKYYHLYEGFIPSTAIEKVAQITL